MFRKLLKNKKAQNTAEYAILISLVVAGIIAMQTYAQRALQAKVRDAGILLGSAGEDELGMTTDQYEPYYLSTSYNVARVDEQTETMLGNAQRYEADSNRFREIGGSQTSTYGEHGLAVNEI